MSLGRPKVEVANPAQPAAPASIGADALKLGSDNTTTNNRASMLGRLALRVGGKQGSGATKTPAPDGSSL